MKILHSLLALVLISVFYSPLVFAEDPNQPAKPAKPILVVMEWEHWSYVNPNKPRMMIYDDGQVIFPKFNKSRKQFEYYHVTLSKEQFKTVKEKIKSFGNYNDMKSYYQLIVNRTCQNISYIYLNFDNQHMVTSVYALEWPARELELMPVWLLSDRIPKRLGMLYHYLVTLELKGAKPWITEYVRVDTMRSGHEDYYKILIKIGSDVEPEFVKDNHFYYRVDQIESLDQFNKTIDKIWECDFCYEFPNEQLWMKAFKRKPKSPAMMEEEKVRKMTQQIAEEMGI